MNRSADDDATGAGSTPTAPGDLTRTVRGEIARFFGGAGRDEPARDHERARHGRLIADLERRILESLDEGPEPAPELGPFRIEERIGRGGFAVVYRATHGRTGARAAVKVVPAADPDSRERVLAEVQCLAALRHPNIVRVLDTGEDGGFAWIATDFIPGMTLADFVREAHGSSETFYVGDDPPRAPSRPSAPRAMTADTVRLVMTWFRDLASALGALHDAGLVHRDVKPANILIDRDQRPFLIDFGLSSSAESTVSGILAGTVPYMSPEQTLGGYVALTSRSDLYSLAVTFHEALTGDRVTHGVRQEAILHQIAFVPVAPPSASAAVIPASLDPIFAKALAKDSNQRYASARELVEDLDRWLAGRPLINVHEPVVRRIARGLRRHPVGTALAAVALIACVAWGAWAYAAREREYQDVLDRAGAARRSGDVRAALEIYATGAPRFGARAELGQGYREAVLLGGPVLAAELLRSQAFAVVGLARNSEHERLAREAERHLHLAKIEEPHMVLVVSLSRFLSGRAAAARAILDGHPGLLETSRDLNEVAAIIAIAEKDRAAFDAATRRRDARPASDLGTIEICLRTWRALACQRAGGPEQPSPAELQRDEADLVRILEIKPDHALARALLGIVKLERKDHRGARLEFDELLSRPGDAGDRVGVTFMRAAAGLLAAGSMSGDERETTIRTSIGHGKAAIAASPPLLERFLHEIMPAAWDVRARWIKEALDGSWPARPAFGPTFLNFTAHAVQGAPPDREPGILAGIGDGIEREYKNVDEASKADYLAVKQFQLWDLSQLLEGAIRAGDHAEARRIAARAETCIAEARARFGSLPYLLIGGQGIVAALTCDAAADPEEKRKLRAEAIRSLREALDADLLDRALEGAPDRATADLIRTLSARCATRLERLESEDEAESRGS